MSDHIPAPGTTVLHQVCVPFSLKDIFGEEDAPADARNVKVDPRSHSVRVTQGPINGHRRIVTSDVVRVLFRTNANAATQYVRRLKDNVEMWEELQPYLLYIQFSGHGVKAIPTLTLEGTYILMLKLPGEVGMGLRRSAADAMMRIAAGDPRLAETLRANARFRDLFTEVAREGVAAADAAADAAAGGAAPAPPAPAADVEDLVRKERELKLRIENVSVTKQEAALRVKTAAATAKAMQTEANGKVAAMKTITNEELATLRRKDDAEHRSRKRRHQDEEVHMARQNLLNLPRAVAELRAALRIADTPEGQKQIDEHIAMWRLLAALPVAAASLQPEEEPGEAPVGPQPGAFTLRGYADSHKSLTQVPADKRFSLLLNAGRLLTQACRTHGIALPAKTNEGGQEVRVYPPAAATHARDILAQLVRDLQKQPNIGRYFQRPAAGAGGDGAEAAAEADA